MIPVIFDRLGNGVPFFRTQIRTNLKYFFFFEDFLFFVMVLRSLLQIDAQTVDAEERRWFDILVLVSDAEASSE